MERNRQDLSFSNGERPKWTPHVGQHFISSFTNLSYMHFLQTEQSTLLLKTAEMEVQDVYLIPSNNSKFFLTETEWHWTAWSWGQNTVAERCTRAELTVTIVFIPQTHADMSSKSNRILSRTSEMGRKAIPNPGATFRASQRHARGGELTGIKAHLEKAVASRRRPPQIHKCRTARRPSSTLS